MQHQYRLPWCNCELFHVFDFLNMVVKTTCVGYQRHIHLHLMKCCSGVTRRLVSQDVWNWGWTERFLKSDSSTFSLSPSFQENYCRVDAGLVWGLSGNTIKINHSWTHWSQIREKRVVKKVIWKYYTIQISQCFYSCKDVCGVVFFRSFSLKLGLGRCAPPIV